jgi:hypothetical protein
LHAKQAGGEAKQACSSAPKAFSRHAKQGWLFLLRSHLCLLCFIAMRSKACEARVAKKQKHGGKCSVAKTPCFVLSPDCFVLYRATPLLASSRVFTAMLLFFCYACFASLASHGDKTKQAEMRA